MTIFQTVRRATGWSDPTLALVGTVCRVSAYLLVVGCGAAGPAGLTLAALAGAAVGAIIVLVAVGVTAEARLQPDGGHGASHWRRVAGAVFAAAFVACVVACGSGGPVRPDQPTKPMWYFNYHKLGVAHYWQGAKAEDNPCKDDAGHASAWLDGWLAAKADDEASRKKD